MKLSVSLPDEDVEFVDVYARRHGDRSRSAVIREALRLLGASELAPDYAAAWEPKSDTRPLKVRFPGRSPGKDPRRAATSSLVGEAVGEGGEGEGGDEPAEADQHLLPVAGDAVPVEGDPSYRFDQ